MAADEAMGEQGESARLRRQVKTRRQHDSSGAEKLDFHRFGHGDSCFPASWTHRAAMPGSMRTPRHGGSLLQHGNRENSTKKHDTQQRKTVSIAHKGGLFLDGLPDRTVAQCMAPAASGVPCAMKYCCIPASRC